MRYSLGVISGLAECHDIIGDALAAHAGILLDLLMEQAKGLRALHGGDRVLPNAHLGMVDESKGLHPPNHIAPEIPDADISVSLLAGGRFIQ